MPRMCACGNKKDNPGIAVILIETDNLYVLVINDTPDKDDEKDIPVHSTADFAEAYERFLSLI